MQTRPSLSLQWTLTSSGGSWSAQKRGWATRQKNFFEVLRKATGVREARVKGYVGHACFGTVLREASIVVASMMPNMSLQVGSGEEDVRVVVVKLVTVVADLNTQIEDTVEGGDGLDFDGIQRHHRVH